MHTVVTGGAGFIGSHVVEQLLADGHQVTVVDNWVSGKRENLPRHRQLKILSDNVLGWNAQDFHQPVDSVVHLAATPSVFSSWEAPMATHKNNLSTVVSVLQLCHKLKASRLVFASSAAVYGNPVQLPIAETHPTLPISPYGLQKLTAERYIQLFAEAMEISAVSLRFFNVFGPRQRPDSHYAGVISILTRLMAENQPITLYGDGWQTRDFIYVKDVAGAIATALTVPLATGQCLTCNVGTGQSTTLIDLVDTLANCFPRWQHALRFSPARPGDIQHSTAQITILSEQLGFSPQWSLRDGLTRLVQETYWKSCAA
jgi:UDP-glucose 4-epimerase